MDFRKGIKEVEVDGEVINLKKGLFGWSIVNPIKDKNNKFIWKNFLFGGSYLKGLFIIGIILLLIFAALEVSNIVNVANECLSNQRILILP